MFSLTMSSSACVAVTWVACTHPATHRATHTPIMDFMVTKRLLRDRKLQLDLVICARVGDTAPWDHRHAIEGEIMVQISRSSTVSSTRHAAIPLTRSSTPTNHETTRLAMKPAREFGLLGVVALMLTSANAAPTHILAILWVCSWQWCRRNVYCTHSLTSVNTHQWMCMPLIDVGGGHLQVGRRWVASPPGDTEISTPIMDALVKEGVELDRHCKNPPFKPP